jgi:hypothetical protein
MIVDAIARACAALIAITVGVGLIGSAILVLLLPLFPDEGGEVRWSSYEVFLLMGLFLFFLGSGIFLSYIGVKHFVSYARQRRFSE